MCLTIILYTDLNYFGIQLKAHSYCKLPLTLLSCVTICNPFPLKTTNRVIRELEAQLEYEREKREKLEAQMDKLRAQIHTLTLQLEDERDRHQTMVGTV